MKKLLFLLLASLVFCMSASAITPEADGYVYNFRGDMDKDGEHEVEDAMIFIKNILNDVQMDKLYADANGDGKINLSDVLRVLKAAVGMVQLEVTAIREYYPVAHLENFKSDSVSVSVTKTGTATATATAKYTDTGVMITVDVVDSIICDNDYVAINMQANNATVRSDNKEIRFDCYGTGKYLLRRAQYSNSNVSYEKISSGTSLAKNEDCYYTHETTEQGYKFTMYASYAFLNVPKEYANGNIRVYLTLRNDDDAASGGGTTAAVHADIGAVYDRPDTWVVIDKDGKFVRRDFDGVSFADDIPEGNAFESVEFWKSLATVSGAKGTPKTAKEGASIFSDRTFGFETYGLPEELAGASYLCAPIAGTTVTVDKAGYVVLLVNEFDSDTKNQTVKDAGFTQVLFAAKTPGNTATKLNVPDLGNWYVKYCEAGESFAFGKWVVAFSAAAENDGFVWETTPGTTVNAAKMDEATAALYKIYDRKWQGIPTGEVTDGGRIIAAFNSGDSGEGKAANYAIITYSDDNGKTWEEAYYIAGPKDSSGTALATVCDIQMWLDRDSDTLHIFYLMSSPQSMFEKSSAVWTCTVTNLDAKSVGDWEFSAHRYLFSGLLRNNITVLEDGTWLAAPNDYMDDRFTKVYASKDNGATWTLRGKAYIPEAINYDETVITELCDGTLWMCVRTTKGVVYQAFSFDKGATWTMSSPTDIYNCTTRFNITRLESGALLMVYNAASGRTDMTAALSYDDGKTWEYSLVLFEDNSTYPDVSVTADGKIHIFFDSHRYDADSTADYFGRVFHTALTEDYIKEHSGETLSADKLDIVSSRENMNGNYNAGNYGEYTLENTAAYENSPLEGKEILFLGSSVTLGYGSFGVSFADFLEVTDKITAVKEAVSGTTLVDSDSTSYVSRLKTVDTSLTPDIFVCQLSTNDAKNENTLGTVSASTAMADFDTSTVAGAIEYIIAYAKGTWNCPVVFYTQANYGNTHYESMVALLHEIEEKWGITVIDLYNDTDFNDITDEQRAIYLIDTIHPTMAGYRDWFLPKFRETFYSIMADTTRNYYPMTYLENFSEKELSISLKAIETATVTYAAEYVENGVTVTATVVDPVSYTIADSIGNGDNISIHMQGTNSIARGDRFAINFLCDANGNYLLRRYSNASSGFVSVTDIDPTVVNDTSYFTYLKTADGYKVTFFASYDFLRMTKEQSFGKVRMLISLRNTDSADSTNYFVYGSDEGIDYDMPNTWLVLDKNNNFTRDDFDTVSFAEDVLATNEFANLAFLNSLATISAGDGCTLREAKGGASVFADRVYCFEESYLPAELVGKTYVHGPIAGSTATVETAGYVVLAVGELANYDSLNEAVKAAGWTQLLYAAGTPYNFAVRTNIPDLVNWYVKYCEAGETVDFGKWAVAFGEGSTTPFVWESKPAYLILDTTDSYYSLSTRSWHGCPTIEVTNGGRVIAGWSSGDTVEGEPGNYGVLSYSDDNGKKWTELGYINSEKEGEEGKETTVCDIQLWLDRDTNTLYCFYIMSSTISKFEKSSAVWMFSVSNPDDDIADWKVSEHRYLFPGLLRNNITVLSDGTWLACPNNYLDERFTVVYASTDKGETWELRGKAYIPEGLSYDETMVTELRDGTLWIAIRANTSKKVMYQAFSFDKGYTWTMSSPSNIFNCATRFNITRLSNGALLMVYNAASGRTMMTAALSYDDGKTWEYAITLYESYTTYPDVSVLNVDGVDQIHIIFDRDRYNYGRVYHGVFTEEYIKANNGKVIDRSTDLNMVTTLK